MRFLSTRHLNEHKVRYGNGGIEGAVKNIDNVFMIVFIAPTSNARDLTSSTAFCIEMNMLRL